VPTKDQVIKLLGKRMWKIMCKTGYIDDNATEISADSLDRAYRAAKGENIHLWKREEL
jgi:hypothetical protein